MPPHKSEASGSLMPEQEVYVKVAVGLKETEDLDREDNGIIIKEDSKCLLIRNKADKGFQDKLYWDLFSSAIGTVVSGYNVALLVCGSQCSGKDTLLQGSNGQNGIMQQVLHSVFQEIQSAEKGEEWQMTISFIQFHADGTARDLFNSSNQDLKALNICMLELVVEGLSEIVVSNAEAAYSLYLQGAKSVEEKNSSLFTLTVEQKGRVHHSASIVQRSVVQVFDLVGEILSTQPGNHISPLMRVLEIEIVGEEGFLPLALQQALRGNSFTVLLYCFNTQGLSEDEILSTLKLLDRVRGVTKRVSPNCWDPSELIQKLRDEARDLRSQLLSCGTDQESALFRLGQVLQQLQVVKNQSWEKKRAISNLVERKMKCQLEPAPANQEAQHLQRERSGLASQLEAMGREQPEASNYQQQQQEEARAQKQHMLQVFHAYQGLLEQQMNGLEQRYRKLLEEAIQDAVHLSARNQQLEAENKQLSAVVAELREKNVKKL
ncbi:centromere-associated protein E [Microcaecilia unicolor]|uniref:Centromere-associated protein E n=1 Tax=Microcaecilia unicolor TaxID=1415580 RepID=A0A6P7YXJ6_9AMPH|nr:centromere-associated protein E [Microcaecilia unicolor]